MSVTASSRIIRFSTFEINLHTGELRKHGQRVKLQEQPLQVLAALLERPGQLVTREELCSKLWPANTFVDFDHGLNAAIKRLREALGDSAETPIFVETVARRGYRFIGNVEAPAATPPAPPSTWQEFFKRNAPQIGVAVCVLVLSIVFHSPSHRSKADQPVVIPVVTDAGEKYTPSLSPDAQHVAFAWNGGSGSNFSIYEKVVGTEEPVRLTKQESIDFDPVWSPDGRYIAFCRIQKNGTGIYVIPSLGGAERRLREGFWEGLMDEILWSAGRLSWSPDGKFLAYSDRAPGTESASIFLLSLDSLEVRRLTSPTHSKGDAYPVFSPDGQTLAFTRVLQNTTPPPRPVNSDSNELQAATMLREWQGFQAIYTIPVSGGEERRLVSNTTHHWGLAWTPDSRSIVFADAGWPVSPGWLWEIPVRGGEPQRLLFSQDGIQPSIRGNRLVYVRQMGNLNVWRRKLSSSYLASPPDSFLSSTKMDSGPQFSPDGSEIAFESTRSGAYEVWTCRSDGTALVQLTHFNSVSGTPRWSPDGRQIAFDSRPAGNADIFVIDSKGGLPRKLTNEPSNDVVPSWSRDGHSIYFASDRTGEWQVWKMPSAGGPAVQVTQHGGFAAFESADGAFLYYAKGLTDPGIWRLPTNGGDEVEIVSSLEAGYWGYWTVVDNGIYYLDSTNKFGISFFDFAAHRTKRLFDLGNRPARQAPGLAVSPDKKTILYTQLDALNNEITLVDNFQ